MKVFAFFLSPPSIPAARQTQDAAPRALFLNDRGLAFGWAILSPAMLLRTWRAHFVQGPGAPRFRDDARHKPQTKQGLFFSRAVSSRQMGMFPCTPGGHLRLKIATQSCIAYSRPLAAPSGSLCEDSSDHRQFRDRATRRRYVERVSFVTWTRRPEKSCCKTVCVCRLRAPRLSIPLQHAVGTMHNFPIFFPRHSCRFGVNGR
ncbi:hypothetical protein F4860DRAFT_225775 [Xylaria cubensis]|nr:hypothetical protein F4860DRAFT_225775 [Xylaria cubensis]